MLQFCPQAGDSQRPVLRYSGRFSLETWSTPPHFIHAQNTEILRIYWFILLTLTWFLTPRVCVFQSPSCHIHLLLCLQATEAHSDSARDQEWLDRLNHILQQKVRLTYLQVTHSCTQRWKLNLKWFIFTCSLRVSDIAKMIVLLCVSNYK